MAPPGGRPPEPRASGRVAGITRVSSGRCADVDRDLLGRVAGRALRRAAVEPVVLGGSLLGHPGALRTISHAKGRYRATMTDPAPRPTSYSRVSLGIIAHATRGQPARQRARRRDHEARRLHRRCGRPPAQRGPAVTAAMDEMTFLEPVHVGDIIKTYAQVNWAGTSSMEIGVRVEAEPWGDASGRRCTSPAPTSCSSPSTTRAARARCRRSSPRRDDVRRLREAEIRRAHRLAKKPRSTRAARSRQRVGAPLPGCDRCDW